MTEALHRKALEVAVEAQTDLTRILSSMGSRVRPDGVIYSAYSRARRLISANAQDKSAVEDIIANFRESIEAQIAALINAGADLGYDSADKSTEIYGLRTPKGSRGELPAIRRTEAIAIAMGIVDTQLNSTRLLIASGNDDPETIIGTDQQPRHFNPAVTAREVSALVPALMLSAWDLYVSYAVTERGLPFDFYKQAIAALDNRTTDTCIGVHAQYQPVDDPFILGGEFPGEKLYPPFHYWCRTVTALVLAQDVEDEMTELMRESALTIARAKAGQIAFPNTPGAGILTPIVL